MFIANKNRTAFNQEVERYKSKMLTMGDGYMKTLVVYYSHDGSKDH